MKNRLTFAALATLFFVANCFALSAVGDGYSLAPPQDVYIEEGVLSWKDEISYGASGYKVEALRKGHWKRVWRGTSPDQEQFSIPSSLRSLKLRVLAYRADEGNGKPTVAIKKPTAIPTVAPTTAPTTAPIIAPTTAPKVVPTATPTTAPVVAPTSFFAVTSLPKTGLGVVGAPSTFGLSTNPRISYDRRLGKLGTAPGLFTDPVDFCFSGQNSEFVYVLERNRVQKIALTNTSTGEVSLAQYYLASLTTDTHIPSALALTTVNGAVKIWVAYPTRNALMCIESDGTSRLYSYATNDFPNGIYALGTRNNRIYAVGYAANVALGAPLASRVVVLDANGQLVGQVKLARGVQFAKRLDIDSAGNILIYAWRWQILKFSPTGALLNVYGTGFKYPTLSDAPRGAAFHNSLAVAADDSVYTMRDGELIQIQSDTFRFCSPILSSTGLLIGGVSSHPEAIPGTVFRVDGNNRLWTLTFSQTAPGGAGSENRPILVRVLDNVFTNYALSPITLEASDVGCVPSLEFVEPYGLYYEAGTGHINVQLPAGPKARASLLCRWSLSDHGGAVVQKGEVTVPLQEAFSSQPIAFPIPQNGAQPRFGWFNFKADFYNGQGQTLLSSRSKHISVTPAWPQLVEVAQKLEAGESAGGLYDPQRAGWAGQIIRLNCDGKSAKSIAKTREYALQCKKYDVPCFLQITNKSEVMSPEGVVNTTNLVGLAEGLGDVIKHFEIINEPTTGYTAISIPKYIEYLKAANSVLKSTNSSINIMGPALVDLNLKQIEQFLALGGGELIDEFSIHDYEGNNTIYAPMRESKWDRVIELLKEYKIDHKPRWQTEHGTLPMFADVLYPYLQMSRIALQRDICARSGIAPERNSVFYLNDHGFGGFKSWIWNRDGAYPAALMGRTHWALVGRKPFTEQLDFGTWGNAMYHGVGYGDSSGVVYVLQDLGVVRPADGFSSTLGARDSKALRFGLSGGAPTVYDVFGNQVPVSVKDGVLSLRLTQSPQFVVLSAGGKLTAPPDEFGINKAKDMTFSWSGSQTAYTWNDTIRGDKTKEQNLALLTDGVTAPTAGTWIGNFGVHEGTEQEGTLIEFGDSLSAKFAPKTISRIALFGTEADNNRCTLMDYNLEIQKSDGTFETVHQVRYNEPSLLQTTLDPARAIGYLDTSKTHVLEFEAREAIGFRLTVLRTSYYTEQTFEAQQMRRQLFGSGMPAQLSLTEIAVF